jgi:uncharacterized membrane protein
MRLVCRFLAVLLALGALGVMPVRTADAFGYSITDVPNAYATYAQGINNSEQVVGGYLDARFRSHGFLWRRTNSYSGTTTPFDVAGAMETYGRGINRASQVVGYFVDAGGKHHGFVREATGAVTPLDATGAIDTYAMGINDAGQVVGWFTDAGAAITAFFITQRPGPSSPWTCPAR